MTADTSAFCNWQDPASYHYTLGLDRMGLAWEFLRRNPTYRATVRAARAAHGGAVELFPAGFPGAAPWGLSFPGG
ncbi:MAG: hypothetical protein JF564_04315 [Sphingomonas sp.]|nr:hypothetical protein [Sphingomonas sp.]